MVFRLMSSMMTKVGGDTDDSSTPIQEQVHTIPVDSQDVLGHHFEVVLI